MKKLIDIPDEILEDLQILAVKDKKPLKNYIENLLFLKVRGEKLNNKELLSNDLSKK